MTAFLTLDAVHRAAGARFVEDLGHALPASYGDPLEEQRFVHRAAGLFDRSYRGVLDIHGKDVAKVMNGVFSSAVAKLRPGEGQMSTLLTAKGRLVAAFQLFAMEDGSIRLVFLEPLRESVIKAVHKYAFLSDVALADRTSLIGVLSVEGPAAERALETLSPGSELPKRTLEFRALPIAGFESASGVIVARAGESPERGFDVWVARPALEPCWLALTGAVRALGGGLAGHEAAEALRIEAGIARQGRDYDDESFPNDLGLEHALTYDKCYVGQEIVARMKTYGQTNRRLEGLILAGERPPSVPSVLKVAGEEVGRVTSAAFSARLGHPIALAMVKRKFWDAKTGEVETEEGPIEAKLIELPFV